MSVYVEIVNGPLKPVQLTPGAGTGEFLCFEGVVREEEDGKKIPGLVYQAYEPMAGKQLDVLARKVMEEHGLLEVAVWHSHGLVKVGEVSFRLVIEARHRREALEAMSEFIDRMKQDVPIWKKPVAPVVSRQRVKAKSAGKVKR